LNGLTIAVINFTELSPCVLVARRRRPNAAIATENTVRRRDFSTVAELFREHGELVVV
jgi:hypothetical protein